MPPGREDQRCVLEGLVHAQVEHIISYIDELLWSPCGLNNRTVMPCFLPCARPHDTI